MPPVLLLLLALGIGGGVAYAVTRPGAGVAPIVRREPDPGFKIGIPGIGDVGASPAPLPTSGSGPGGAPTLGDLLATADPIMLGGAPDLLVEGNYQTTYGAGSLSLGNMIEDMRNRGWPRDRMSVWRVGGGSLELPVIGGLADVRNIILVRSQAPALKGRTTNQTALIVDSDYACKAAFLGARGC